MRRKSILPCIIWLLLITIEATSSVLSFDQGLTLSTLHKKRKIFPYKNFIIIITYISYIWWLVRNNGEYLNKNHKALIFKKKPRNTSILYSIQSNYPRTGNTMCTCMSLPVVVTGGRKSKHREAVYEKTGVYL